MLNELRRLTECYGFVLAGTRGSCWLNKAPGVREAVNLQPMPNVKAKAYAVRQVLKHIEAQRGQDG